MLFRSIKITEITSKSSSKSQTSSKENTNLVTYDLYKNGKSIDEISKIRGFTRQTIENHLIACYELDLDINLTKDIQIQFEKEIFHVIDEFGFQKLKILKENLPKQVSYFDIRYFVAKYKKTK